MVSHPHPGDCARSMLRAIFLARLRGAQKAFDVLGCSVWRIKMQHVTSLLDADMRALFKAFQPLLTHLALTHPGKN